MGKPFERTMAVTNGMLKPMAQLLKENPIPPYQEYAYLLAAAIDQNVTHYTDIAAAMEDENRKVALYEFGLVPQLFHAFDCAALCLEMFPSFYTRTDESAVYDFLEAAEGADAGEGAHAPGATPTHRNPLRVELESTRSLTRSATRLRIQMLFQLPPRSTLVFLS